MGAIKKFFAILFLCLALLVAMVSFSILGEQSYEKNCTELGISCEEGRIHHLTRLFFEWCNKIADKTATIEPELPENPTP